MDNLMDGFSTSYHSYPKIWALGHRAITELLLDPVIVEEKVDGSQFSFGKFLMEDGSIDFRARSKGATLNIYAPEAMFKKAIEVAQNLDLKVGWTYRAEYLQKPKHNTLVYDRVPKDHLIIFDINTGDEEYMGYNSKLAEAQRLGLECVPLMFSGMITDPQQFRDLLNTPSILGGQKVEGVVVKNYKRFGDDKKALMGKFVSEEFKESHGKEWKSSNPTQGDVVELLKQKFRTAARWSKAVQHLKEAGKLDGSPRDIGNLIKEVQADVEGECADEIKEVLYKWALPHLKRGLTAGLPEWYKDVLLKAQFEQDN